MVLKNKTILLISSEAWGDIYISKHNYAIALAERGNQVYFLNPVLESLPRGSIQCEKSLVHTNLFIITYRPFFPWFIKFHFRSLFDLLMKRQARKILKKIDEPVNVVWDFNCSYLFKDLKTFAPISIFHPVDHISDEVRNKQATLFVTISDNLLSQYANAKVPKLKIDHGLSDNYVSIAKQPVRPYFSQSYYNACYIGNLIISTLDREVLLEIVDANQNITFHFIGPFDAKGNNVDVNGQNKNTDEFIALLRSRKNVILYGIKTQKEIADMLLQFDFFLICYKQTATFNNDNSHKLMEYLSSGKVVISSYLSSYKDSDMLIMSRHNEELPNVVKSAIPMLNFYNSIDLQKKRKAFVLERTYEKNIQRIEQKLSSII